MSVIILINGVKVGKGTKYTYDLKKKNDIVDTFDGPDISEDEFGQWTIKISRVLSFDPNFENNLTKALIANIPIVVSGTLGNKNFVDYYTGGYLDSLGGDASPGKKGTEDLSFTSLKRTRTWKAR
jgi:hypothetical protein